MSYYTDDDVDHDDPKIDDVPEDDYADHLPDFWTGPPEPRAELAGNLDCDGRDDDMTDAWDGRPGLSCEGLRDVIVELLKADPRFAAVGPDNPGPDPGIAVAMAKPVDLDFYIEVRTGY